MQFLILFFLGVALHIFYGSIHKRILPKDRRLLYCAGDFGGGDDGGSEIPQINVKSPDWWEDPLYKESQDLSFGYGKGIMQGKLPDFYSSLGKTGSSEFQNMLNLVNTNATKAVQENNVRRNITRSGVGASSVARAVADSTTSLSWQDYLKAAQEKAGLLGTGLDTISGVRSGALSLTGSKNAFNQGNANLQADIQKANASIAAQNKAFAAQQDSGWGDILGSAIGSVGTIAGMFL